MKLTITEAALLKDAVSIISELVTEAQFTAGSDGLGLIALDPATVAMVDFRLLASAFTEYEVDGEESIALNLLNFKQVLRRAGSADSVTLETKENKLVITIKGNSTRTFSLPLIDLDEGKRQVPNISYTATITTRGDKLASAIDDADIVAESVTLLAEEKRFRVLAEGDLSKVDIEIDQDDDTKIVLVDKIDGSDVELPVRARYSIEYLKKMVQSSKLADKVTLQFRNDHPVKLEYKALNKVSLTFILAPRVEND